VIKINSKNIRKQIKNNMTNWKAYKITRIDNYEGLMILKLNGKVTWGDRENPGKEIGFTDDSVSVLDCYPFNTWRIDDYIEIDLGKSVNWRWAEPIRDTSIVRKVSSSAVVSRNNNNIPSISRNEVRGIISTINSAIDDDERNEYEAKIHVDPNSGKYSGFSIIGRRK